MSNDRRNPDGVQDCSCAAQNIMLAAHSLGLGFVWLNPLMTLCDEPEIRALLRMIAEGVENAAQARFLQSWGCSEMQGFYFYKPMSVQEFEAMEEKA